jgi:hypothetical protein
MGTSKKVVSFKTTTQSDRLNLLSHKTHTIKDNQEKDELIIDLIIFFLGVGMICLVLM